MNARVIFENVAGRELSFVESYDFGACLCLLLRSERKKTLSAPDKRGKEVIFWDTLPYYSRKTYIVTPR